MDKFSLARPRKHFRLCERLACENWRQEIFSPIFAAKFLASLSRSAACINRAPKVARAFGARVRATNVTVSSRIVSGAILLSLSLTERKQREHSGAKGCNLREQFTAAADWRGCLFVCLFQPNRIGSRRFRPSEGARAMGRLTQLINAERPVARPVRDRGGQADRLARCSSNEVFAPPRAIMDSAALCAVSPRPRSAAGRSDEWPARFQLVAILQPAHKHAPPLQPASARAARSGRDRRPPAASCARISV